VIPYWTRNLYSSLLWWCCDEWWWVTWRWVFGTGVDGWWWVFCHCYTLYISALLFYRILFLPLYTYLQYSEPGTWWCLYDSLHLAIYLCRFIQRFLLDYTLYGGGVPCIVIHLYLLEVTTVMAVYCHRVQALRCVYYTACDYTCHVTFLIVVPLPLPVLMITCATCPFHSRMPLFYSTGETWWLPYYSACATCRPTTIPNLLEACDHYLYTICLITSAHLLIIQQCTITYHDVIYSTLTILLLRFWCILFIVVVGGTIWLYWEVH